MDHPIAQVLNLGRWPYPIALTPDPTTLVANLVANVVKSNLNTATMFATRFATRVAFDGYLKPRRFVA